MNCQRTVTFIDGLNLYHAIKRLKRNDLQWLDLKALSNIFINSNFEKLTDVFYFSAFADHIEKSVQKCQKNYINALKIIGIKSIFGHFKRKNRKCPKCNNKWIGYEEKETDVNIALFLLDLAYQNSFDRALIITNDSDLAPAIQITLKRFPQKRITTIAPPDCYHSNELIKISSDKARIKTKHLERSLLPEQITDASKKIIVSRPKEYSAFSITK